MRRVGRCGAVSPWGCSLPPAWAKCRGVKGEGWRHIPKCRRVLLPLPERAPKSLQLITWGGSLCPTGPLCARTPRAESQGHPSPSSACRSGERLLWEKPQALYMNPLLATSTSPHTCRPV